MKIIKSECRHEFHKIYIKLNVVVTALYVDETLADLIGIIIKSFFKQINIKS